MLSCSICSDKYLHICATCKLRLCKNHKLIHQKDKSKSHNFKSSNQAAECLNFSGLVSEIPRVATVKVIPCTPNLPFTQKTQDILNWYSQEYPVSSKPVKNLNLKKAKYFKFALAQENKIFLSAHTSVIRSILITKDNQYIISGSKDNTIRIWSPPGFKKRSSSALILAPDARERPQSEKILCSQSSLSPSKFWFQLCVSILTRTCKTAL